MKMIFMRHTVANDLCSENLHHHFCSCLYLTWCTVNICPLHFVGFIFYFSSLSRGHHMCMIIALSTKFTSCEYAHVNILKRDVAIKIFPFSKFGGGEPVSPLASMLQKSYHIHKCNRTYIHTQYGPRFRAEFFENRRNMRKTYTFLFIFKISSTGIYTGFCTVVQFLKSCRKFLFFGPSLIYQIQLLGSQYHPQTAVILTSFSTWGIENSPAEISLGSTGGG